ncbi:MAG: S41 family peptidase, partial [Bacteroidota bacterium]
QPSPLPRTQDETLSFRWLDDGTAYLSIGSFATFQMEGDFEAWIVDAFQKMRAGQAERLIVDLRGTPGGVDEAASFLFQHLLQEPVEIDLWRGSSAYDVLPEDLRPHIRSWSADIYDLTDQVTPTNDGRFSLRVRPPMTIRPAPDAFSGPVAVLVDAAASSATFYLADRIKQTGAALLVGQETGGSRAGLNGGQMAFLELPNSGVVVDVPLFASRPVNPGPDQGVIPERIVQLDADAVIIGRDPEIEAAIDLLRGHSIRELHD